MSAASASSAVAAVLPSLAALSSSAAAAVEDPAAVDSGEVGGLGKVGCETSRRHPRACERRPATAAAGVGPWAKLRSSVTFFVNVIEKSTSGIYNWVHSLSMYSSGLVNAVGSSPALVNAVGSSPALVNAVGPSPALVNAVRSSPALLASVESSPPRSWKPWGPPLCLWPLPWLCWFPRRSPPCPCRPWPSTCSSSSGRHSPSSRKSASDRD